MSQIEFVSGVPEPYSNHVVIERTKTETYRVEGLSNANGGTPEHFVSRHFTDLEEAKAAAAVWADQNDIRRVLLPSLPL